MSKHTRWATNCTFTQECAKNLQLSKRTTPANIAYVGCILIIAHSCNVSKWVLSHCMAGCVHWVRFVAWCSVDMKFRAENIALHTKRDATQRIRAPDISHGLRCSTHRWFKHFHETRFEINSWRNWGATSIFADRIDFCITSYPAKSVIFFKVVLYFNRSRKEKLTVSVSSSACCVDVCSVTDFLNAKSTKDARGARGEVK